MCKKLRPQLGSQKLGHVGPNYVLILFPWMYLVKNKGDIRNPRIEFSRNRH